MRPGWEWWLLGAQSTARRVSSGQKGGSWTGPFHSTLLLWKGQEGPAWRGARLLTFPAARTVSGKPWQAGMPAGPVAFRPGMAGESWAGSPRRCIASGAQLLSRSSLPISPWEGAPGLTALVPMPHSGSPGE